MAKIANKVLVKNGVRFDFLNGVTITALVDTFPENIVKRLAVHGLSQKIGDSYASAETMEEAVANARAVLNNLAADLWATKTVRGGKIVEALVRVTGKSYDECLKVWIGMDDNAQSAVKKHPDIKAALAAIEAERAKALANAASDEKGTDLGALFN